MTGALFGIAILACVFRFYVQLAVQRRFPTEDWILVVAVILLIANTVVYFISLKDNYEVFGDQDAVEVIGRIWRLKKYESALL